MKKNPMWLAGLLVAIAMAFGLATPGHAASILGVSVSLADLIDGGPVTVGDKEFSNFDYTPTGGARRGGRCHRVRSVR